MFFLLILFHDRRSCFFLLDTFFNFKVFFLIPFCNKINHLTLVFKSVFLFYIIDYSVCSFTDIYSDINPILPPIYQIHRMSFFH